MTVENFSDLVGVSRGMVYFWMHDKHRPTEDAMVRVCQVLDVPLKEGLSKYTPKLTGRPGTAKTVSTVPGSRRVKSYVQRKRKG